MKILCFGDSNTYGYDPRGYLGGQYDHPWPEIVAQKLGCTVLNWGENGRQIPDGTMVFPEDTDLLIIMLGTNDLLQGISPEEVCYRMGYFLEHVDYEKVLLIAPPPLKLGAWVPTQSLIDNCISLAEHYRSLAKRLGVQFADAGEWNVSIAYDGVHLTEEGNRAFALELIEYINKGE